MSIKKLLSRKAMKRCPFCFSNIYLPELLFRCETSPLLCGVEVDPVLQRVWNDSTPVSRVIDPKGRKTSAVCPNCNQVSRCQICPSCHQSLPAGFTSATSLIFSIIGDRGAGKTSYLAVLIDELKNRIGPQVDLLVEPANDATIWRYRKQFYEPLFKRGFDDKPGHSYFEIMPMLFSVTVIKRNIFNRPVAKKTILLTLLDIDTEQDNRHISNIEKYVSLSDGLILLIDANNLKGVKRQIPATTKLGQLEGAEVLSRFTNIVKNRRYSSSSAVIDVPIAVVFSKFEAMDNMIDAQMQINRRSRHNSGFDVDDFHAVHDELVGLCQKWEPSLLSQVEKNYRNFGFFGVSTFGQPNIQKGAFEVLPRRIEDPFLWLLHQYGLLAKAKN